MLDRIWVLPVQKDRVAISEYHPDHPGDGNAFVYWPQGFELEDIEPVEVAQTPFVNERLGRFLRQVPNPVPAKKKTATRQGPSRADKRITAIPEREPEE